jgi:hypothetical protein
MQDDAENIVKAGLTAVPDGDVRLQTRSGTNCAGRRDNPVSFTLPATDRAAEPAKARASVIAA